MTPNNKSMLLQKLNFIEEHSEYVFEQHSNNVYNDLREFVNEYYDEVYESYQLELCGYVDVEY